MGLEAGDEEVVALAENGSCALDAIQVLTGCTLGKGNLRVLDHGKMSFTFWERRTNRGLRIKIRPQAMKRARDLADSEQETKMQRLCELILEIPDEELFSFEEVHSQPPEPARVEPSVACQRCGELVMGSRLQHYRGVGLCIPCLREVKGG
jgi:formylmethanofuran dehydrogenase subunit E